MNNGHPLEVWPPAIRPDAYNRMIQVLDEVAAERARQRELLRNGHIKFDCADPAVHIDKKLRALMEEVGEVAREIDLIEQAPNEEAAQMLKENLRAECIQVAAVAAAIAESLTEAGR